MIKKAIALGFREQDTVRHQFDEGVWGRLIGKPYFEPHGGTKGDRQFICNSGRKASSCESSRLCVSNQAVDTTSSFQAEFGKLGRLSGTRFTTKDENPVALNHLDDRLCMFGDWQFRGQDNFGNGSPTLLAFLVRILDA